MDASSRNLPPMQLEILSDLVQYLSCDDPPPLDASSETYFKLRFEAAEARYGRMRALVCASLEKQAQLQNERCALELSGLMKHLRVYGTMDATILWSTMNELKAAREEVGKLKEMNQRLRETSPSSAIPALLPPPVELRGRINAEAELQTAYKKISAFELELVRMNDQQFEMEERVREHQDVIDRLLGKEAPDAEPVPARYHPIHTCASTACQNYAKRLRNGLRQAVADAYVRDRCVRLHGHFRNVVLPMEALLLEKDVQIDALRLRLARLECATSADDVVAVDEDMARRRCEMEKLKASANALRAEHEGLKKSRKALFDENQGLRDEIRDARNTLEAANEQRILCKAETQCLETERERVDQAWARVQSFLDGQMAIDYERMRREYQTLERQLGVLRVGRP